VGRRAQFDEQVVWHMQADLIIRGPLLDPVPAALLFNKMRRTTPGLNWSKAPKDAFHSEDGVSKPSK